MKNEPEANGKKAPLEDDALDAVSGGLTVPWQNGTIELPDPNVSNNYIMECPDCHTTDTRNFTPVTDLAAGKFGFRCTCGCFWTPGR